MMPTKDDRKFRGLYVLLASTLILLTSIFLVATTPGLSSRPITILSFSVPGLAIVLSIILAILTAYILEGVY